MRAAVRSRAPPALSSQYYFVVQFNEIPQLPALPYAPQPALAPLQLCPPSTIHLYYNSTKIPRRRMRHTRRSPLSPPSGFVLPVLHLYDNSTIIVRSRAPPALSSSITFVLQFNEKPSASRAAVRSAVRAAVRSRAPPALSSQYYIGTKIDSTKIPQLPAAPCVPPYAPRRSPLSRPSGSVFPVLHLYYNSTKIPQLPAPQYAPPYAPQPALAPLRLSVLPVLHLYYNNNEIPSASYRASYILCNITYNITYKLGCQSYKSSNLDNWTGSVITKSCQLANLEN